MKKNVTTAIKEAEKASLRATRVFRGLSDAEFEYAIKRSRPHGARYERGSIVAEAESRRDEFLILVSGRVQGVREHGDGSLDFVQLFVPGEIVGLDIVCSASRKCPFRLLALDDTDIVFVDYDGLFSGKISPLAEKMLREGVTRALAGESLRRLHKIDVLYRRALRDRICVYLRNLCIQSGSHYVEINMDREQFAQYLGVNRSALSHELGLMRDEGLIAFHKGSFEILADDL
ncbi:MAG: Crp/Fnr family transcriptional regulator [Clostridiales Family XIII bacterium]|jgi:CRP-like cAMP-binding protein|nr:Crp/Fnr family transcriptional regulator [Clostridiales Family XIII bacterium]